MPKTPEENTGLALVKRYVENQGGAHEQLLSVAEWDLLEDYDRELVIFRLKDKSQIPFRGVALGLAEDDLRRFDRSRLAETVGRAFLRWLDLGLPEKEPGQPYHLEVIPYA